MGSIAAEWTTTNGDNEIVLGAWYAEAISANYIELNLAAADIIPFETVQVTFGYTWLDLEKDDESDNELSIEFGASPLESLDFTAAFVYSTEAGGTFVEMFYSI